MDPVLSGILILAALPVAYLALLAFASIPGSKPPAIREPDTRFAILVPAHNEASVIGTTVSIMRELDYPPHLFDIHVVADHCSDDTAALAREAGAIVHERTAGPDGSKAAAVRWALTRIIEDLAPTMLPYRAVVLFDADTHVSPNFLRVMDARLAGGDRVIQGQHRIGNPGAGWFAALTNAMFLIDNRFHNQGRANLGCSAKNMGDAICFRTDILRRLNLSDGLAEDYAFRQSLLLAGIKIRYEPAAIAFGEAPPNLKVARTQRMRWLRGVLDSNRENAWTLLRECLRRRERALLDGVFQTLLPSYSSLVILMGAGWMIHLLLAPDALWFRTAWVTVTLFLLGYPFFGLALERAPANAYAAIMTGPAYVLWRTWLSLASRFGNEPVTWIRTEHGTQSTSRNRPVGK